MKKYILIFAAVIFAFAITAFTFSPLTTPQKTVTAEWWKLMDDGNPNTPEHYEPFGQIQPCNGQSEIVCGVYTVEDTENPGFPDLELKTSTVKKP